MNNHLDFVIQDCLKSYSDVYTTSAKSIDEILPLVLENLSSHKSTDLVSPESPLTPAIAMPSLFQSAQKVDSADVPKQNILFDSMEMASPVSSPGTLEDAPKVLFTCLKCSESYRALRELKRHQKKHNNPNKHGCTIMGCKRTFYRSDAMRVHVRSHERRMEKMY
jgi:uncharacterized Zn-finger protein